MSQIEKLLELFQKLNHTVNNYIFAYKVYKSALKTLSESENNSADDEKARIKKEDAERKMHFALGEAKKILEEIDKLFDDESREFSPISEEIKNNIDDEYMELIGSMKSIEYSMQIGSNKKLSNILEMHDKLLKEFDKLENNLTVYNHNAESNGWKFKSIAPENAHSNYEEMSKRLNDSWERKYHNRKTEGLIYQKP